MDYLVWIVCALIYKGFTNADDQPCKKRASKYGYVCVCDSSYCDTVERPPALPPGQFHRYTTSNTSPGFTRTLGHFSHFSSDVEYVFTINTSMPRQEVFGIGGSITNSVGALYKNLSGGAQEMFMESYFGLQGIEYSMVRLPIGSSDFSPRSYTLAEIPFDDELRYFNLTDEEIIFKIPLLQKAASLSERGVKLIGCTWDAPVWMKLDNGTFGGYVRQNYSSIWAKYHVKFLDAYKREGLEFWGLSGGNELVLNYLISVRLPMVSTVMQQRDWFKNHLKPQLVAANYSDVKLITLDDQRLFAPYWIKRFADDPEAFDTVDAIGLHWYFDVYVPPTVLDSLHLDYPDKYILYTETSVNFAMGPDKVQLGSWARAERYAHSIMETLNHWTQSYLDWNLALNTEGGPTIKSNIDAPVIINTTSGEFYKQPMFYVLGHFSKFIPPGSRVVKVIRDNSENNSSEGHQDVTDKKRPQIYTGKQIEDISPFVLPSNLQCTATANSDGSYSISVINLKDRTVRVRVEDPQVGSITYPMEPHSIDTFVYWK